MERGEVRWYKFHPPDKRRPVVILTRSSALLFLSEVTIAPITTTVRDIPSEVLLTEADGMSRVCAINFDHMQTVSKAKLGGLITTLGHDKLDKIRKAIEFSLGL